MEKNNNKDLEIRISILEWFCAIIFSICITLIYAIVRIQQIWFNWPALIKYFLLFFGLAMIFIGIVFPIIKIVLKVGQNLKDIKSEFIKEYREKNKLNKCKTIVAIFISIGAIIQLILLFIEKLK